MWGGGACWVGALRPLVDIVSLIAAWHLQVADPPKGGNSFKSDVDFHRVAQGRCVDMLVAHTKKAPWLDKAFKGALRFTSVRDPIQRATSGFLHSRACGRHCAMCFKLLDDQVGGTKTAVEEHSTGGSTRDGCT